jgi:hypothetical protein
MANGNKKIRNKIVKQYKGWYHEARWWMFKKE